MPEMALYALALTLSLTAPTGRAVVFERPLEAMVRIPAGRFKMGASDEAEHAAEQRCREQLGKTGQGCELSNEVPEREVWLDGFSIDRVEVTVAAYRACVRAGACSPRPLDQPDRRLLLPDLPITWVTWDEARAYCRHQGARLPTEAEWERAARGRDGRTFPWGNIPRQDLANHGRFHTVGELGPQPLVVMQPDAKDGYAFLAPVGSYPGGASPDGVLDLAGNVAEWTADVYGAEPPEKSSSVNPRGPAEGSKRTVRGGSFREPLLFLRVTARDGLPPDFRSPEVGFRCAR